MKNSQQIKTRLIKLIEESETIALLPTTKRKITIKEMLATPPVLMNLLIKILENEKKELKQIDKEIQKVSKSA
ncbi:hypothetical protein ACFL10_00445 [Patescibacteria group bacterium]